MKLEKKMSNLSVAASVRPLVSTLVILITRPIKVVAKQLDDVLVSGALLPSSHLVLFFKFDSSISSQQALTTASGMASSQARGTSGERSLKKIPHL